MPQVETIPLAPPPSRPATTPPRPTSRPGAPAGTERLLSLDAYRGLIMTALMFKGFGLAQTAALHLKATPDSEFWKFIRFHFEHAEWVGGGFWDMIQPSFMFMVGVSMPFSYARRQERGDSWLRSLGHAVWRSIVLILLGVFLSSNGAAGTWLAYLLYPTAGIDLQNGAPDVDVTAQWAQAHLTDVAPAWHKNANVGHAVDLVVLNQFPRTKPFAFNNGGYQTINFIPSLATMLFGLMCGELLRSDRAARQKLLILFAAGAIGILAGIACSWLGCPLVKRIWTPSWALYSGGICILILAMFYLVIDFAGQKAWSFPLVVVGMNSIAAYLLGQLLVPWTRTTLQTHFGKDVFQQMGVQLAKLLAWIDPARFDGEAIKQFGVLNEPLMQNLAVGAVFWLVLYWMYRRKIYLRI